MNKVCLIGRLTKNSQMKYTANGKSVSNFSIAISDWGLDGYVSYIDCALWNSESRDQYLTKGIQVGIEGYLKQERWDDKDGKKRSRVIVVVQNLSLLSNKKDEQRIVESSDQNLFSSYLNENDNKGTQEFSDSELDDIPF